mmetsp:Transcript_18331/g.59114  ORF Transcript_18331/g.59114 Transcript_18331/m.59114 type:complete len:146 (-) Transcript_18331:1407-1844(-)
MLRNGTASALGETTTLSPAGTYRPYDKLIELWKKYCNDVLSMTSLRIDEPERVFKAAISLWLSQGAIVDDAGLVFLQPSVITDLIRPLVDHRLRSEVESEEIMPDVVAFVKERGLDNDDIGKLRCELRTFVESGEISSGALLAFL